MVKILILCFAGYAINLALYYWFKIRPITLRAFKEMANLPGLEQLDNEEDVEKNPQLLVARQLLMNDLFSIRKYFMVKFAKELLWIWVPLALMLILFFL
jgi:hypothetical protein